MTVRPRSLAATYHANRFACLFVTLLLTIGAGAMVETVAARYNPLQVFLAVNLVAAVATTERSRVTVLLLVIGGGFVIARLLRFVLGMPGMLGLSETLWLFGIVLATAAAVRHALRSGAVDRERIMAALDAYLLAGLLFGAVYWMLERRWPGSFGGPAVSEFDLAQAIYFSFVTIATLGYGDVVPVSEPARRLAIVEGVSGQLYLTVLVARLVSLYARQRDD